MEILIKRINKSAKMPVYSHESGAVLDLFVSEEVTVAPGARMIVSTGVALALPAGHIGVIWGHYDQVINEALKVKAGMIGYEYRDEIKVELANDGTEARTFSSGDKIARLVIQKINRPTFIEVEDIGGEG